MNLADGGKTQASSGGNGFTVVAHALAKAGIKNIYGVVGIPVTELASAAQVDICIVPISLFPLVTMLGWERHSRINYNHNRSAWRGFSLHIAHICKRPNPA